LDYLLGFKYATTDGYRDHGSEDLIRPSGAIGIQAFDELRLTGEYSYFRKRMELPGRIESPSNLATRQNQAVDFEVGVGLYPFPGQQIKGNFFGTVSRTDEDPLEESFDDRFLGTSTVFTDNALTAGVEFWTERLQNFYSYQKVSGFLGVSGMDVYDTLVVESLLQIDYYEGMEVRFGPKVALSWYLTDRLSASLKVHRDMEVRSWSESYLSEYYVEGNLIEIRPQREVEGEFKFSYRMFGGWTTSLAFFRREIKDLFIWQDFDGNGLYTLVNHPEALIQGGALEMHSELTPALTGHANFTFQEVEGEEQSSREIPYMPKIKIQGELDWKGPYGFGLGTSVSYLGSQFIDVTGPSQIQDYVLWDIRASYEWRNFTFFVKVFNVLDQRYDIFAGYPGPDTQYQFGTNVQF
jgi:outer membrane receptor for ferrienterochelin and colicin